MNDIHIITPVGPTTDPDHLANCLHSVQAQIDLPEGTHLTHHLILDGLLPESQLYQAITTQDLASPTEGDYTLLITELSTPTADVGSTPRTIGAAYAWGLGAHAIAFLDADNLYLETHLAQLLAFQAKTGKAIVTSGRYLLSHDGAHRAPCRETVPGAGFHDTSTFLITRAAIELSFTYALLTADQHPCGDRFLSSRAAPYLACHYHPTLLYRTRRKCHYRWHNWPLPTDIDLLDPVPIPA